MIWAVQLELLLYAAWNLRGPRLDNFESGYFNFCFRFLGLGKTGNLMIHTGDPRGEEMIPTYLFLMSYIIPPARAGFLNRGAQIEVKWLVSPFHLAHFGSISHIGETRS